MSRIGDRGRLSRRALRAGSAAGVVALLAAGTLAGCGGSGSSAHTGTTTSAPSPRAGPLSVRPAHPSTRSTISFSFTAPVASGVHGTHVINYSLSVTGTGRAGCVGAHERNAPPVGRGQTARIALGPGELGGPWCTGSYTARVIELESAHCRASVPCPQYIRVVGTVARASFTVTR